MMKGEFLRAAIVHGNNHIRIADTHAVSNLTIGIRIKFQRFKKAGNFFRSIHLNI